MDPFSAAASAIGIMGVGAQAVGAAHSIRDKCGNYRDAGAQMKHAKAKSDLLDTIRQNPSFKSNSKLDPAASSFGVIGAKLPTNLNVTTKLRRMKWTMKDRKEFMGLTSQLSEIESSSCLSLALDHSTQFENIQGVLQETATKDDIHEVQDTIQELAEDVAAMKVKVVEGHLYHSKSALPQQETTHWTDNRVYRWFSNYTGISFSLIASRSDGQTSHNAFIRWLISSKKVLKGQIQSLRAPWPALMIYPSFHVHNVVPPDAPMVEACRYGNTIRMGELLSAGLAAANDITTDNMTMLYFAIMSEVGSAVELLLNQGADPNLTYGQWETSPLNTAFSVGRVEVVQMLLDKGAALEYTNCRMWTSARYIFEPHRAQHNSLDLLEFFAALEPAFWDSQDCVGWTILHRAAAFGKGGDVKKILSMQGSPLIRTHELNWVPIFCAVNEGNEATFDALLVGFELEILTLRDTRGWSLLHLAAMSGSLKILTSLLDLGLHPEEETIPSRLVLPKELERRKLTAGEIARHYHMEAVYEQALEATGWVREISDDE